MIACRLAAAEDLPGQLPGPARLDAWTSCRTAARCAGISGRVFGRQLIGPAGHVLNCVRFGHNYRDGSTLRGDLRKDLQPAADRCALDAWTSCGTAARCAGISGKIFSRQLIGAPWPSSDCRQARCCCGRSTKAAGAPGRTKTAASAPVFSSNQRSRAQGIYQGSCTGRRALENFPPGVFGRVGVGSRLGPGPSPSRCGISGTAAPV